MVFGNKGDDSGTGVGFTRDPSTGQPGMWGEFLVNAQGEDVVAGIRTPEPIAGMKERFPAAFDQLAETMARLEEHYREMQDIEFTIEQGALYLLQTRTGKRTAAAALRIAVEMVGEGLLSREEAVARIDPAQLDQLLHPRIDPAAEYDVAAKGLNASPGAATGRIVLDADRAQELGRAGEAVILVRTETTPDDIHGIIEARGVLTAHGGMTSHAAVVARGMGKPCVSGCDALSIDLSTRRIRLGSQELAEGDLLTIDGGTGDVIVGEVLLVPPQIDDSFETLLGWADAIRRLRVRANADTPEDAVKAREFGAEGIGLCRTEHMFMAEERLPLVRAMIMASSEDERREALDRLLPFQQEDFEGILEAMGGLPVTIRLLDPPLHEFLPPLEEAESEEMARRIRSLHEANPMLGTRGCRLGILYPEIYEMQVRAIVRAALAVADRSGNEPLVEIMHPLVGFAEELRRLRRLTLDTASSELEQGSRQLDYLIGTMIELPRACLRADEIAAEADFFSFGTNDLTQTTLGFSRDDAEGTFLTRYLEDRILETNPFETLDVGGVGDLMRDRRRAGAGRRGRDQARHLRRARRRRALRRLLPRAGPRVRLLLALPGAARPPGRRAGGALRARRHDRPGRRLVRNRRRLVAGAHLVDPPGQTVGQLGVADLEDVLGVELARMREVVAPREDVVVRNGELRVHEVMDVVAVAVRGRGFPGEAPVREHAGNQRQLPLGVSVQGPLVVDAAHLRPVDDAGDVDLPVGDALGQGAEDRPGGEHRRAHTDAAPRLLDPLGDASRERLAAPGREPRPHLPPADVDRIRVDEAAPLHGARRPELLEVLV